jgi:hypothetical protein
MNTDEHGCNKAFEGKARHSVRAVVGVFAGGGQGTARPTIPCFLSVFIRVYPWLKFSSPATRQMTGIATSRCCDLFLVPMDKYD